MTEEFEKYLDKLIEDLLKNSVEYTEEELLEYQLREEAWDWIYDREESIFADEELLVDDDLPDNQPPLWEDDDVQ